ncbi:MAG: hypothetical protein ACI4M8_02220, partial [Christensenellales bacterium]
KATGGMGISVGAGHAKLGGAWFENERAYNITLDVGGDSLRYDCVIIRNDDSEDVREPSIIIKSLSAPPTLNDLTRDDKVYEICIAYVQVAALRTSISATNIVDTRTHGTLCNVMSGVGATVVRTYRNTYFSETENQTVIPIGIKQYNRTIDRLTVIVEGRVFTAGANYEVTDNSTITLAIGLPVVGTKIEFEVAKNVNAAGAETVVQEVAELREEMDAANKILAYDYYCNGVNDNVKIGDIVRAFQSVTGYGSMRLSVHGTFGATAPARGSGTSSSVYGWFNFYQETAPTRRCFVDFSNCSAINLPIPDGTTNIIFYGSWVDIIGANVVVNNTSVNTIIRVFNSAGGAISCENSRFWITSYQDSYISNSGTFTNCRGSVANTINNSYCFLPASNGIVRIIGGEYYAYSSGSYSSAIVGQSGANAVSILYGVNAPTVARSGYSQTNSLLQYEGGGMLNCTDLISALPMIVVAGISNIRGTIALSKAGNM